MSETLSQPVTLSNSAVKRLHAILAKSGGEWVPTSWAKAAEQVASLAAAGRRLEADVPGLRVVHRAAPRMGFDPAGPEADDALDAIAASGARFVLIALGAPRQERFALLGRSRHPALCFASIGAGLDFLSGAQRRAPAWVRALALEWLWRMAGNPRRPARRYALSARVLPGLIREALRQRRARS